MSKLFFVFGTEGSGKSTVLSGLSSAKIINVGDEMFKAYSEEFKITNRDEIRAKSLANYAFMVKTRNRILKEAGGMDGTVVVDTHATVKKGDAYEMGLSLNDLDALKGKAAGIIYIDASNKEILERRAKDTNRNRQKDTEAILDRQRNINISALTVFALRMEVPIYILENANGKVEATRTRIQEIMSEKE